MGGNLYEMPIKTREQQYEALNDIQKDQLRREWQDWEERYPLCNLMMNMKAKEHSDPVGFNKNVKTIEKLIETRLHGK